MKFTLSSQPRPFYESKPYKPSPDKGRAMPSAPAGRSSTEAAARLRHPATIRIAGPSQAFLSLTRNPSLEPPARFEPTTKREGDIVL